MIRSGTRSQWLRLISASVMSTSTSTATERDLEWVYRRFSSMRGTDVVSTHVMPVHLVHTTQRPFTSDTRVYGRLIMIFYGGNWKAAYRRNKASWSRTWGLWVSVDDWALSMSTLRTTPILQSYACQLCRITLLRSIHRSILTESSRELIKPP